MVKMMCVGGPKHGQFLEVDLDSVHFPLAMPDPLEVEVANPGHSLSRVFGPTYRTVWYMPVKVAMFGRVFRVLVCNTVVDQNTAMAEALLCVEMLPIWRLAPTVPQADALPW